MSSLCQCKVPTEGKWCTCCCKPIDDDPDALNLKDYHAGYLDGFTTGRAQQPTDGALRQLINSWRELSDSADLYAAESKKANYPAEKIVKHATTAYDLKKCASELEGTLVAIESVSKLQSSSKAFEREVQGPTSPTLREAVIQECCKILLDNGEHRAEWILLRALAAQASSDPLDKPSGGGNHD